MSCGPSTGFFFLLFFFCVLSSVVVVHKPRTISIASGFFLCFIRLHKTTVRRRKKNILHTDDILIVSYILCKTIHFCVCVWCAYDHTNETDLRSLDSAVFFVLWYFSAASLLFSFMIMVWKKITLANSQFETK